MNFQNGNWPVSIEIFCADHPPSEESWRAIQKLCAGEPFAPDLNDFCSRLRQKEHSHLSPQFAIALWRPVIFDKSNNELARCSTSVLRPALMCVGCAFWRVILDEAELDYVIVDPSFRGYGLARDLLDVSHQRLKGLDVRRVTLEVSKKNLAAIKLYSSAGYKFLALRKRYYSNGDDAEIYYKAI